MRRRLSYDELSKIKFYAKKLLYRSWKKIHELIDDQRLNKPPDLKFEYIPFGSIRYFCAGITRITGDKLLIIINLRYLLKYNYRQFLDQVLMHEIAHVVSYKIYGIDQSDLESDGHGNHWKEICKLLKIPEDPYHDFIL